MNNGISRRAALGGIGLALAGARKLPASIYGNQKVTALVIAGDRYHNLDYIRTALGRTLGTELGLTMDFSDEVTLLAPRYLKDYKMLIMLRDGVKYLGGYGAGGGGRGGRAVSEPPIPAFDDKETPWMTADEGKAIKDFVQGGGAGLFLHNCTYMSQHNQDFREMIGGITLEHPAIRPFKVKIVNHDHPITRGVNDFVVTDEQHFEKFERDQKYVLMQSVNEDGLTWRDNGTSSIAGWAFDSGKGRVCYLAPGHTIPALWNPEYVKIQKNAAKWLLKELS